jgi:hypothetical protein
LGKGRGLIEIPYRPYASLTFKSTPQVVSMWGNPDTDTYLNNAEAGKANTRFFGNRSERHLED